MLHKVYSRPAYLERVYLSASVDSYIQDSDNSKECKWCSQWKPALSFPSPFPLTPSSNYIPEKLFTRLWFSGDLYLFIFVLIAYRLYLILAITLHYRKKCIGIGSCLSLLCKIVLTTWKTVLEIVWLIMLVILIFISNHLGST